MKRATIGLALCLLAGAGHAQTAGNPCGPAAAATVAANPLRPMPPAPELAPAARPLGAAGGVLALAVDETLSLDNVLHRQRQAECLALARAVPATGPALPSASDPAAYKPKTQFDNTPWRFDMSQDGKRMTAEEFDAWMKARGVRVAKGAAPAVVPPPAPAETREDDK